MYRSNMIAFSLLAILKHFVQCAEIISLQKERCKSKQNFMIWGWKFRLMNVPPASLDCRDFVVSLQAPARNFFGEFLRIL